MGSVDVVLKASKHERRVQKSSYGEQAGVATQAAQSAPLCAALEVQI